jgi:hypothetical protein
VLGVPLMSKSVYAIHVAAELGDAAMAAWSKASGSIPAILITRLGFLHRFLDKGQIWADDVRCMFAAGMWCLSHRETSPLRLRCLSRLAAGWAPERWPYPERPDGSIVVPWPTTTSRAGSSKAIYIYHIYDYIYMCVCAHHICMHIDIIYVVSD